MQYLINPEGKFVTFYGKNFTAAQIADSLCEHIRKWKSAHADYKGAPKLTA
jgi:protein SCO1